MVVLVLGLAICSKLAAHALQKVSYSAALHHSGGLSDVLSAAHRHCSQTVEWCTSLSLSGL